MAVINCNTTVGDTAIKISPVDYVPGFAIAIRVPSDGDTIYIGGSTVTTDSGYPVYAGEQLFLDTDEAIFAIAEADQDIQVLAIEVQQ